MYAFWFSIAYTVVANLNGYSVIIMHVFNSWIGKIYIYTIITNLFLLKTIRKGKDQVKKPWQFKRRHIT